MTNLEKYARQLSIDPGAVVELWSLKAESHLSSIVDNLKVWAWIEAHRWQS